MRGPKLLAPNLSDILADPQPFVIESRPYARFKRHIYVYSQLVESNEALLDGIQFMDHENNITYSVRRKGHVFVPNHKGVYGPWNSDKFNVFANKYETTLSCTDLRKEFESNRYSFEIP